MSIAKDIVVAAENVHKVYMAGATDFGLKGKAEGRLVTFNNVHPIEHNVSVRLGSKNLFNKAMADITETEDYFTSGIHYSQGAFFEMAVEPDEVYTVSYLACTPDENVWGAQLLLGICPSPIYAAGSRIAFTTIQERHWNTFSADAFTFKVPAEVYTIYFQANTVFRFKNFQIEKGSAKSEYTPYISDFSDIKVTARGKNVYSLETPYNIDGATRLVLWEGDTPQYIGFMWDVTIESIQHGGSAAIWKFTRADGTIFYDISYKTFPEGKITPEKVVKAEMVNYAIIVGTINKIQIEIGATPTEYTDYIEPVEYTAKADGTVEGVKSISPVMNLSADAEGAIVSAECFLEPKSAIGQIENILVSLGGDI